MMLGYYISRLVDLYSLVMLFWVITSWVPSLRRYEIVGLVGKLCEPVLSRARRLMPATGGLDFSPMVVLFVLQLIASGLRRGGF